MQAAVQRVRKVEPHWSPRPSAHSTVEGQIAANEAATREAEVRYQDLQRVGCVPGPYAVESQPARGPGRDWIAEEILENNRIGGKYGCHTCGTKEPGTRSGNFILDHQRSSSLIEQNEEQLIFQQCLGYSNRQGGNVRVLKYRYYND